jgi:hypothetical protein
MPDYTVRQGDCISSIAEKHGLNWENIWNHSNNAQLKEERGDPNVLYPGDVVFVPEKLEKQDSGATEQRHRFRKMGTPAKLRLRIMKEPEPEEPETQQSAANGSDNQDSENSYTEDPQVEDSQPREDEPNSNVSYTLEVDGNLICGSTDDDGFIECSIPPNAQSGRLIIEPNTPRELSVPLMLGHLNPLSEVSGIKERLANLGFDCGDTDDSITPDFQAAISAFQEKHGLDETGEADQTTLDKLREVHGS